MGVRTHSPFPWVADSDSCWRRAAARGEGAALADVVGTACCGGSVYQPLREALSCLRV